MTGAGSARLLADKRGQGLIVYGEVTAAALATAAQCDMGSWSHGAAYLTSPPLRPDPETPQILMDLLSRWKFVKIRLVVVGGGGTGSRACKALGRVEMEMVLVGKFERLI